MKYRKGFKYQLAADEVCQLPFAPDYDIVTEYIRFNRDGLFWLKEGYAWDGPSGPTLDTPNSMTPSVRHDGGYQLMRAGLLPQSFKPLFDAQLEKDCLKRGMSHFRAEYWEMGVHLFGAGSACVQQDIIYEAP